MSEAQSSAVVKPAGLLRRVGALVSDSLVVTGLLLLGSLMFVPLLHYLNAKAVVPSEVGWIWASVYWIWLLAIWISFFGFFWARRGQTVGMQAWRVRVEDEQGALLTWPLVCKRLWYATVPWLPSLFVLQIAEYLHSSTLKVVGQGLAGLGVLGLLWMYFDPHRRTWHDRITQTRVITLPKL